MVAVADKELIGKKFKFRNTDFFVNPRFYKGRSASEKEIIVLLKSAVSMNLVGAKSVACGKSSGAISDENILMISKKVPHAQAIVMQI
ncbi:TPA: DUF424 family protein [archaeon]|uniref:DUF424 family protein n=1 Tax=Candidatus Naiadarchaeum limnaeum TaxID=2756139 RepID=A0A832V2R1_9ARCH|nr:DUF424 family protein [Candidatus Naiadarchaeum limnaeum]